MLKSKSSPYIAAGKENIFKWVSSKYVKIDFSKRRDLTTP